VTDPSASSAMLQLYRIYIRAIPQEVWDAITKPEWTARWYGFASAVEYDLRPGGAYRGYASDEMKNRGAEQGFPVPDLVVDGEVIEADPPRRLVQTYRLLVTPELEEEGFTRLTYEIEEVEGGVCKLTVIHDLTGAPQLAALVTGERERQGGGGGWPEVLSALKTLLETGTSMRG
jgi:uncharacterized protein YndB with AHSA1/START domain